MITGIAFVYAVLLNTVVATPLLRTLVANHLGRALDIQYAHAYSLVPGRVHVTELSLRGADSHVEWLVKIDRASFDVHPFALLHRQFRASRVYARGVAVRVRLLEGMPAPEHDSHVPPIQGFSDPPLKLAGPPVTSVDGKYDLFTIELDGVTARNVYEVWVDTLRFAGDFDVRGRWEFRPLRRLAIGPASVDVARLDVARGSDAAFVTAIHGHLGVTIDPYDVRLPTPRETLRYLSLRADVTAVVRASELFRMVRVPESLATPNGDATLMVAGALERGVVATGSTADVIMPEASVRAYSTDVHATVLAHGQVNGTTGVLDVELRDVSLARHSLVSARADAILGTFRIPGVDVALPLSTVEYVVDVPELSAPHLDPWGPLLDGKVEMRSGPARLALGVSGSTGERTATGTATVDVSQLTLDRSGMSIAADVHAATVATVEGQSARGSLKVAVTRACASGSAVEMSGALSGNAAAWSVDWSRDTPIVRSGPASVVLRGLELRHRSSSSTSAALVRSAELSGTTNDIVFERGASVGRVAVKLASAVIPDLRNVARWVQMPSGVELSGGAATATANGDVDVHTLTVSGGARLDVSQVALRRRGATLVGDVSVTVAAQRHLGSQVTELAGSALALEHVNADGDAGWWANAVVQRGGVELTADGWRGQLSLAVVARDAKPLDAFVATYVAVPAWVLGLVPLPAFEAHGEVRFNRSAVALRGVEARSGSTSLRLELFKNGSGSRGLLLLGHGELGVGFGLGDETPRVTLTGAGSWFARRKAMFERASLGW